MNEPFLFKQSQLRDSRGRFCTRQSHLADRAIRQNGFLAYEREKYMRMYLSVARDNERLTREILALKEQLRISQTK